MTDSDKPMPGCSPPTQSNDGKTRSPTLPSSDTSSPTVSISTQAYSSTSAATASEPALQERHVERKDTTPPVVKDSRRRSTSERVLEFFTGLLTGTHVNEVEAKLNQEAPQSVQTGEELANEGTEDNQGNVILPLKTLISG